MQVWSGSSAKILRPAAWVVRPTVSTASLDYAIARARTFARVSVTDCAVGTVGGHERKQDF
jgi:hypothetical protein